MKEIHTFSQYFITYTVLFTNGPNLGCMCSLFACWIKILIFSPILKVITDNPMLVWIELPSYSIIVPSPPPLPYKLNFAEMG